MFLNLSSARSTKWINEEKVPIKHGGIYWYDIHMGLYEFEVMPKLVFKHVNAISDEW